jgi:branched-chain amino acid transport system substrate-binding protein
MSNNRASQSLAALFLATVFFGANAQTLKAPTIKVGVSGPFTGGSSPMGQSMRNGIRLAVEEINGIGGVNGKKIELVERDDESKPAVGIEIANELIKKERVVATIGIVNTGVGLASIDIYQNAKVPLMVAVSTGTALTRKFAPHAAPDNYIFRVSPTLDLEAKVIVADLARKGIHKVAVLADTTAYGDACLKAFLDQARLANIETPGIERFNVGDKDMSGQIKAVKATRAQALVIWGIGPELAAIAKEKETVGWKVPLLGSWTLSMANFTDTAGRAGEGALMPQTFIQDLGSTSKNGFLFAYKRAFNTEFIPSPMSAAQGYDGMHLLFSALRQANSSDGEKIRIALETLRFRYQGVITNYYKPFSRADHDAITQNMVLMGRVSSGRVDYAYVEDQKRGGMVRTKKHDEQK